MVDSISKGEFLKLLKAEKPSEIQDFLSKLDIADSSSNPQGHKFKWKPVGNSLSNAANIENVTVSIASIVERIINAFDANLELLKKKNTGDMPASPRQAVERWLKIPNGDMGKYGAKLSNDKRAKISSLCKVIFHDSGDERKPSIVIRDYGIGQIPKDFSTTLLRLGDSNKISSPYLHGTYGHGGSSTYRFCEYSVIISRKHKEAIEKEDDDLIGWTIVRKDNSLNIYSEKDSRVVPIKKPPVYQYLCLSSGEIPVVHPGKEINFEYGTHIGHIGYNANNWYNLSRGLGYRLFRNYLFDPVFPFRLEDLRPGFDSFNRNMFGARSTLLESGDVVYANEVENFFPDGGKLKIRYWVLFDPNDPGKSPLINYIERENSRNTIILTLNGQRHGTREKSIISKELRLSNLSNHLLVQVEIDNLSRQMKSELFISNRENIVESDAIKLIEERLKETLNEDEELKNWERKLMVQISRITDDESKKAVKKILNKLIQIGIQPGIGGSQEVKVPGGTGTEFKYKPQDPPTNLRFITSQDPIELIQGESRRLTLEINGPDNLLTRRKKKYRLTYSIPKDSKISLVYNPRDLSDGRLPITFYSEDDAETFVPRKIKISLEGEGLKNPLEVEKTLIIVSPPVFTPADPPTELKFLRIPPIKLYRGKSNYIGVSMNGSDDLLDRPTNKSVFSVSFAHNKVHVIRIRKPRRGEMALSLLVDKDATVGDTFEISIELKNADGTVLQDKAKATILEPVDKKSNHGGTTTVTLPNYDIQEVYREDWGPLQWNETSVGKFVSTIDQDNKDKLILMINVDNENIISEVSRRCAIGQQRTSESIKKRYVAYIAYHLYLMYESENQEKSQAPANNETGEETEDTDSRTMSDEEKSREYERVSRTLVLSFQAITQLAEDES